jgi:integrator complex subunit 11
MCWCLAKTKTYKQMTTRKTKQESVMRVVPLGAGQDVGRSCVIVTLGRKNIMFDCGMHMGYNDERKFPDFSFISKTGQFTQTIDCVIISHL